MPRNIEQFSHHEHRVFLGHFPFMEPVRLFGEVPEFGHYVDEGRDVYPPNDPMRTIHEVFLETLEGLEVPMPHATGGMKTGSPVRNIKPHTSSRYFCLMDLKSAYKQVDMFSLAHILVANGLEADPVMLEDFLNSYCLSPGGKGLATGAPSCPMLFNIACQNMDNSLAVVAGEFGLKPLRHFSVSKLL